MKQLIDINYVQSRNQNLEEEATKENVDYSNQRIQQRLWKAAAKDYSLEEDEEAVQYIYIIQQNMACPALSIM